MKAFYADLHIHIGWTEDGRPVKISGSKNLTFRNIAHEAAIRKGIELIGIIDCHSPAVQSEISRYIADGEMEEGTGGGIRYRDTTILLGSEIEVRDPGLGPAHLLAYLPTLEIMRDFTAWMSKHMKNVELSSQRIYVPARELQQQVISRGGVLIPAHIFTPHKSIYGSCSGKMSDLLELEDVAAVELGLSADSEMAGLLPELDRYTYLTNSDAHSLPRIGREYNRIRMESATFEEWVKALRRQEGRGVTANYGLNPRLGKYHRTYCSSCESIVDEQESSAVRCLYCGSGKIVRGVMDRIREVAGREEPFVPDYRPPYVYQVPLQFIPGLGPKKLEQLLARFGTEMNILHEAQPDQLSEIVGDEIAGTIVQARAGTLTVEAGGGGRYGKVSRH
jgi:uncharacterized protein (TIGR00375 family)